MPGLLTALLVFTLLPLVSPAPAAGAGGQWPVANPRIVRGFEAPLSRYGTGHRGIDIPVSPGEPVRAIGSGTVRFAGEVARTPTVSITHDKVVSTYQPVEPAVNEGTWVNRGDIVGYVSAARLASHTREYPILHLGIRDSTTLDYLNPLIVLAHQPRLVATTHHTSSPR